MSAIWATYHFRQYRDIQPGERFRFVHMLTGQPRGEILTRDRGRWYRDPQGRRFTTGAMVRVLITE